MRTLLACALLLLGTTLAQPAAAQAYPTRPIRIIVPFAAGAFPDIVARVVGQKMGANMGQPVVVDNRPGAGGNTGTEAAIRATPDGYTLLLNSVANAIGKSLYPNLTFDPARGVLPVSQITSVSNVLVVPPGSGIATLPELLALARTRKLKFASGGNGTTSHLAGEMLKMAAKVDMEHIPYRNFGQALTDTMAGRVDFVIPNIPPTVQQIQAGQLRAIAVTGEHRSALLPNVPTMAEAGMAGFLVASWNGLAAPLGTPRPIIDRLNAEVAKALQDPDVVRSLAEQGADIVRGTPEQYGALMDAEVARWAAVVAAAGAEVK